MSIRSGIEREFEIDESKIKFQLEVDKINKMLGCTISELSGENDLALMYKLKVTVE